jgi:hypothetical protein
MKTGIEAHMINELESMRERFSNLGMTTEEAIKILEGVARVRTDDLAWLLWAVDSEIPEYIPTFGECPGRQKKDRLKALFKLFPHQPTAEDPLERPK